MASFNLTAEINLRGPSNIKKVVGDIKRELGDIQANVSIKLSNSAAKNISGITSNVNALNDALIRAQTSASNLSSTIASIGGASNNLSKNLGSIGSNIGTISSSADTVSKSINQATSEMAEFGKQSALAVRRFAAFSVGTAAIYGLARAFTSAFDEFVKFDRQIVRLKQTTGGFGQDIDDISSEISRLSTTLGVSSSDLIEVSVTLAQAGLSATETKGALEALAKTTLSPSFEDITKTTEGAIAAMRQFGISTNDLESALSSINAVAAAFAVESSDIIAAIQRTGGVFASASRGVSEGKDALNEFIAVFTSVRATTRESAETIATGLRTIFTRLQRPKTIEALREFGVELTDAKGKFVGAYEAISRISQGLQGLDTRDIKFAKITEELGGFRQIGKVIPLIQEFQTSQEALKVALQGQGSLSQNAVQAQEALAVQFSKTREEFLSFVRSLGETGTFKNIINFGLSLTRVLIQVADSFKPILPYLAIIGGLKGASALTEYVGGFVQNIGSSKKNTQVQAQEPDLLGSIFGSSKEKKTSDAIVTDRLEALLSENSAALATVTSALNSLERTIASKMGGGPATTGETPLGFARGGYVPGSGNGDTVPAMLQPGEFVIRKKAVETIGANKLQNMNKYGIGGRIGKFRKGGKIQKFKEGGGVADVDFVEGYDGDSFRVNFTPTASPYETMTRLVGADTYEIRGKGSDISPEKAQAATKITTDWAREASQTNKLTSAFKKANRYDNFGRPMFEAPDLIDTLRSQNLLTGRFEKKNLGGLIQKFADGGKALRKIGYIDYDVIANEANKAVVDEGMKKAGVKGPRLYADYLTDLAVKARKNSDLDKLRAIYGVAGSGKTTLARGQGTDIGTLRETQRFPILSPEDIQKASEVLVLTSSVSRDKLEGFLSEVDRAYTLSSTTPAEQDRIRKQRASRDLTGIGLEGRAPGTTGGVGTDTAIGEALLGDVLGKRSTVLGRTDEGRLRAKSKDELVDVIKKRIGFTWGGFAPTTRGHESIIDAASSYGIPPEDFIALVGANEAVRAGDPSTYRTAIMDQDARTLLAKAGFGARGATVLKKPRDFEVPQGFDISEPGGRRKVLLPGAGSMTFVADKEEDQLTKYKRAGYDVAKIPRTEGISGTMVRELIAAGDLGRLQEVLSPGVYDMISNNIGRLQNRANILPSIIEQVQASQAVSLAEIEKEIAATGIKRADRKRADSDPEYAAQVEVYDQLRKKRDKIKDAGAFEPYQLLARLAALEPDKYGLDFSTRPTLGSMGSVGKLKTDAVAKQYGGMIQKLMAGGVATEDIGSSILEKLLPKTSEDDDLETLLGMVKTLGGNEKTRNLADIQSVSIGGQNVQTSDLISATKLRGYSRNDPAKLKEYLPYVRQVIDKAVEKYNSGLKGQYNLAQMPNNDFGLVGLTPFDFEKTYGPMLIGGKKTTILAKGLGSQYQDVVAQLSAELSGAVDTFAYNMQMKNIFGGSGPLAFDFDETLVKDAGIFDANGRPERNAAYDDLTKVSAGLQNAKLTPLGEELKKRLDQNPELLDNIRVLTARPANNEPLVAQTLARLGLNIPQGLITGVGGWRNKIHNIGDMETLIDDKLETIQAFHQAGKPAVAYQPLVENLAGRAVQAGQASMEGAAAEKVLAKLGAQLIPDADPTRPIDYPDGLGIHAAQYWGMDPNLPTEVKRDLNSDAVGRTKEEIGRFYKLYADRYKVGGEVTESELLGKYKQLIASILPPEMISTDGLLRKPGGGGEPITIVPPEDQTKTLREKMFAILLGKPQPKEDRGASYSGGLMYKILRKNLEDAKPDLPAKEYDALSRFVKENLMFEGEDDIINLAQQKRPGSFAHESFHDIQGYLLDYFPQVYKELQSGIDRERKSIEAWYSDPSTEKWRTNRDYQLRHLYPESYADTPYPSSTGTIQANTYRLTKTKLSDQARMIGEQTAMDLGRAEAIPVLMAASAEGDPLSTSILSRIFGGAGLNPDFYKTMPKFAGGGKVTKEEIMAELKDQAAKLGTTLDPLTLESMAERELVKRSSNKNFGKIGLWNEGATISASYLKGTGAGVGAVHASKIGRLYSVESAGTNEGYGPKLYDIVMEAATANGSMLVSDRSSVSQDAYGVWSKYFSSRPDVSKTPLTDPVEWYTGERYFDTKAFGSQDPSTWPPYSDPAWILQTAYAKQPSLIDSDLVQKFAQGGSAQDTVPALLTPGEFVINKKAAQKIGYGKLNKLNKADKLQGFNKGGSVGFVQRFVDGGTPKAFSEVEVLAALTAAAKEAAISLKDFADFVKVNADLGAKAAKSRGESLLFQSAAAESAAISTSVKGTSFNKTFESMFGQFDTYQVGQVLIDAVNKIIANAKPQVSTPTPPPVPQTPTPTPPPITTKPSAGKPPALPTTVEKFDLLAAAASLSLEKLTERIKQFAADTAIAYKTVIPAKQTTTKAAIALATDPASRNEQSIKNAGDQIKSLLEATGGFTPEQIQTAMEQAIAKMQQGGNSQQVIDSNSNLATAINNSISSQDALKYSLEEASKRFGVLTEDMKPNETLLRGIESGRWKGRSLADVERMQKSSEENPFWDKLAGNKFPGFDLLSSVAPEAAQKLGTMTEKAGGFISVLGGGMAIFGNSLPKAYKGLDALAGSSLATNSILQGFAKSLNQAGAEAVGMSKLAQQSGLTVKEQGIATISTALLAGISGAIEGAMNQVAKNNAEAFGTASSDFDRLTEQLKMPGIQPEQSDEIRQQMLDSLATMDKAALSFDDMISTDTTKYLYDFTAALKDGVVTFVTTLATLKMAGFKSKGGPVSYYSNGDMVGGFEPKGTDTVPAMLTPGEFVVNAKSTRKNKRLLEAINSNSYMSKGGVVYLKTGGDFIKEQIVQKLDSTGENLMFGALPGPQSLAVEYVVKPIFKNNFATDDATAGRPSSGYLGQLSDFYNPFDADFYKSSQDATEAVLKFGGRVAALTAIITSAYAAVISFGPAVGTFFLKTLPGYFSTAWSMISSGASTAWGTITSMFTGGATAGTTATTAGTGTTLVGAGVPSGATAVTTGGTVAAAAKTTSILTTIMGYAKNLMYLAGITGVLSFGFSLLQRLGVIGNRDSQGILANTKQLEQLREFSRVGLEKKDYTDLKSTITGSKGLSGRDRDIYFTKQSPIIEQFQRVQLLNKDFQIGLDESVGDFIAGLDEENRKKAQTIADEAQMSYVKKAILDSEVKRFQSMGMSTQEAQKKAIKSTSPLGSVKTLQEALDKALVDQDFAKLLNQALNITGIEAQSQLLQEVFGRLASKIQTQTDTIMLSIKQFNDSIIFGSDTLKNSMEIELPNLIGNRMGGANPQFRMDRQSLNVLSHLSANSDEAINNAVQDIAPKLGLSETTTKETQARFRGVRAIETELPTVLRKVSEELTRPLAKGETRRSETEILREGLKDVVDKAIGSDQGNMSELLLQETVAALTKDNRNESGTSGVARYLTDATALKTALKGVTDITDAMRKAADAAYDLADQQMKLAQESGKYFTQTVQYRASMAKSMAESRISLREAKGQRVTLQEAFQPLEAEIQKLTSGGIAVTRDIRDPNREVRVGWQNQPTIDPDIIASRLEDLDKKRREMVPTRDQLNARLAVAVQNKNQKAIDDTTAEINALNQAFALNTSESDSLSLALKKLSEDTSRSSRALRELQDIRATNQSRENNLLNFLSQANNPQAMIEMMRKGASLGAVMNSDKVRLDQATLLRILPDAIEAARLRESSLPAPERQDFRNQFGQSLTLALKNAGIGAELADRVTEGMWGKSKEEQAAQDEFQRVEAERLKAQEAVAQRMEMASGSWMTKVDESGTLWKTAVAESVKELNTVIQAIKDKQAADAAAEAKRQAEVREIQGAVSGGAGGGGVAANVQLPTIDASDVTINGGTIRLNAPIDLQPITVSGGTKGAGAATRRSKGGIIYASDGQYVNFQPKGTDTVPAMLTPGEFVVNRKATQKNLGLLKSINNGGAGYSHGGVVYLKNGSKDPVGSRSFRGTFDIGDGSPSRPYLASTTEGYKELENLRFNKKLKAGIKYKMGNDVYTVGQYSMNNRSQLEDTFRNIDNFVGGMQAFQTARNSGKSPAYFMKQDAISYAYANKDGGYFSWTDRLYNSPENYNTLSEIESVHENIGDKPSLGNLYGFIPSTNKGRTAFAIGMGEAAIAAATALAVGALTAAFVGGTGGLGLLILPAIAGGLASALTSQAILPGAYSALGILDDRDAAIAADPEAYGRGQTTVALATVASAPATSALRASGGIGARAAAALEPFKGELIERTINSGASMTGDVAGQILVNLTKAIYNRIDRKNLGVVVPETASITGVDAIDSALSMGAETFGNINWQSVLLSGATGFAMGAKGVGETGADVQVGKALIETSNWLNDRTMLAALESKGIQVPPNVRAGGGTETTTTRMPTMAGKKSGPIAVETKYIRPDEYIRTLPPDVRQMVLDEAALRGGAIPGYKTAVAASRSLGARAVFSPDRMKQYSDRLKLQGEKPEVFTAIGGLSDDRDVKNYADQMSESPEMGPRTLGVDDKGRPRPGVAPGVSVGSHVGLPKWWQKLLGIEPEYANKFDPKSTDPKNKGGHQGPGSYWTREMIDNLLYMRQNLRNALASGQSLDTALETTGIGYGNLNPKTKDALSRMRNLFGDDPADPIVLKDMNDKLASLGSSPLNPSFTPFDAIKEFVRQMEIIGENPAAWREAIPASETPSNLIQPGARAGATDVRLSDPQALRQYGYARSTDIINETLKQHGQSFIQRLAGETTGRAADAYKESALRYLEEEEEKHKNTQYHRHGGLIYASNGNLVNFQPKGTDTVPAMLTPGEFVVNRQATQKNLPLLKSINNGYYNKGGMVRYFQDGGYNAGGQSGGGVLLGVDTSSLDAAFGAFQGSVQTMKSVLDDFGKNVSNIKIGDNFTDIVDASRKLSTAAASIRNASDNFGTNISKLNETLASLEKSIGAIPSTIALQVSGGIPVNVNVTINDGKGLDETLQPFADTIYTNIAQALSKATDGNVNIQLKTTKGALV